MTAYWLAGRGCHRLLIGITTFFNRDERRFKSNFRSIAPLLAYIFLLGTYPAGPAPSLMPFVHSLPYARVAYG